MAKQWRGIAKDFIAAMKQNFIGKGADPNSIIVQDLYNFESSPRSLAYPSVTNKGYVDEHTSKQMFEQLFQIYKEHITTKRELLTQARMLFDTDVVQTIIDVIMDDGFNAFIDDKDEFRIEYHLPEDERDILGETYEQEIQEHIDEFVEKFAIKTRIPEMIPELLRDGEYALGVIIEKGKGIVDIVDDLDVINLLPFYLNDKLTFVMKQDEKKVSGANLGSTRYVSTDLTADNDKPLIYKPENIVFFRLKYFQKERINMSEFYNTEYRNQFYKETGVRLPKFMRICRPIYYSAIKSLNKLQIMENLNTILELYAILRPEIVNVSVPSTTSPGEAAQIIRDYERRLNDVSAFTDADALDMTTLAAMANKRLVLPQWLDGKGTLSTSNINENSKAADSWDNIDKLRTLIAVSVGIPPFYITLNSTPTDKHQIVKMYSRYTKKLTSLQKSLGDGIKDLLIRHLSAKGLNINEHNILVKFKSITSGDSLDDTDMMVATIEGINNLYKGIEEICSSEYNDLVLDSEQFKDLFDSLTSKYLNISNLIKVDEHKFDNPEEEFNDDLGGPADTGFDDSEAPDIGSDERLPGSEDSSFEEFGNSTEDTSGGGTLVENPEIPEETGGADAENS